jgi:IS5 family transposase
MSQPSAGGIKAMPESELKDATRIVYPMKAAVRSKAEQPFRVVKRQLGHQKARLMDLVKNTARILTLFALSNLWTMRRTLPAFAGEVRRWLGGIWRNKAPKASLDHSKN